MDFTEGTITIDGHDIKKASVQAKRVNAFLPDNPDIYEFMKGIEYLNFIADLYDIPAEQCTADIGKYSGAFELTDNLGSPIGSYSHGMRLSEEKRIQRYRFSFLWNVVSGGVVMLLIVMGPATLEDTGFRPISFLQ